MKKKKAPETAPFLLLRRIGCTFRHMVAAQEFPERYTEYFAAVHNDQNQGSKPRSGR